MSRPRLPSELHPDYPKGVRGIDERTGVPTYQGPSLAALRAFYDAHPEFEDEGEWQFQCEMCGSEIDEDHCYCAECGDHAGEWVRVNAEGEVIE